MTHRSTHRSATRGEAGATAEGRPLVRRVDHVMVRTPDPAALFAVLTEGLGLPAHQEPMTHPGGFTNAAVGLGDAYLECIRFGPPSGRPEGTSRLWGLAFEPAAPLYESRRGLKARRIPHAAPQVFERPDRDGGWQKMWATLLFGVLKEGWKARAAFGAQRLFGGLQQRQMRRLAEKAHRGEETGGMDERRLDGMNDAIGHGWTFLCEYAEGFVDADALRTELREAMRERGGGPLGVRRLDDVVVGAKDPEGARERWARLFAPTLPEEEGLWRAGDGPAVRVVAHGEDRLVAIVLAVESAEGAERALADRGMLGETSEGEVRVLPSSVGGLDVRLVEDRG